MLKNNYTSPDFSVEQRLQEIKIEELYDITEKLNNSIDTNFDSFELGLTVTSIRVKVEYLSTSIATESIGLLERLNQVLIQIAAKLDKDPIAQELVVLIQEINLTIFYFNFKLNEGELILEESLGSGTPYAEALKTKLPQYYNFLSTNNNTQIRMMAWEIQNRLHDLGHSESAQLQIAA